MVKNLLGNILWFWWTPYEKEIRQRDLCHRWRRRMPIWENWPRRLLHHDKEIGVKLLKSIQRSGLGQTKSTLKTMSKIEAGAKLYADTHCFTALQNSSRQASQIKITCIEKRRVGENPALLKYL